jgi:hypothetical protein
MTQLAAAMLLVGAACIEPLVAQAPTVIPNARIGDHVRVESPAVFGIRVTGPILEANQGFVVVAVGDERASMVVPWAMITAIDVSTGRARTNFAVKGALIGLGVALLATPPLWDRKLQIGGLATNQGVIASIAVPAGSALVGWLAAPPRWRLVDWRPSIDTVLPEGELVRLRLPVDAPILVRSNRRTFKAFAVASGDSLVVRTGMGVQSLPWSAVSRLSVRGNRDRARGAAIGFTAMSAASAVWLKTRPPERGARPAEVVVTNILAGSVVGAIIGTRGWARLPLPTR